MCLCLAGSKSAKGITPDGFGMGKTKDVSSALGMLPCGL